MTVSQPDSARPLVLVVEDEYALLELAREMFEQLGCRVMCALSGEAALDMFALEPVNFVFTDLRLGGMGGDGLIDALIERDPKVAIVATSALLEELDRVRLKWGKRVRYLLKPYRMTDLTAILAIEVV